MKSLLLTVFSCFFIANAFSQVNLNQGLIGYFPFNGDANDRSGYNNHPTYNSGTLAPDRFGNPNQAYWFNGINDNMTIPGAAGLNTATAMTVALYFNPETTDLATLVGKIDYVNGNGTQFQVAINWSQQPGVLFGINNPADACGSQFAVNSAYVNTGGPLPVNQWYCLAATYDRGVQKIYLNGILIQQRTTTFTTLKQCTNSDIHIGTWWAGGEQRFKGRIDDVRIYNRALSQAEVTALCTVCSGGPITDFYFKQDVCSPLSVQFTGAGGNLLDPHWDFGDGTPQATIPSPVHTYANPGNYPVKFVVQNGNCKDTITKTITVKVDPEDIVLTPDTTICSGSPLQLQAKPALSYCWSPGTNLSSTSIANPVTTATQTTTYYLSSQAHTNNLVVNGNFNNGGTGFTSSYTYSSNGVAEGVYYVSSNPQAFHPVMPLCGDHTSGTGNMMLVNGATQANVPVWTQTVNITPNTNYAFSTWLQHMTSLNPAKLQFSINGIPIGTIFQANNVNCIWDQFYTVWNSGNKTTATISIINQNTGLSGNDFALDDIEFSELKVVIDSVKVMVAPPLPHTPKQTIYICPGNSVKIGTGEKNAKYTWNTGANTDSIIINTAGTYWVQTDRFNCTNKDTFVIFQNAPAADFTYKQDICNPLVTQFFGVGNFTSSGWNFGDGKTAINILNTTNTYAVFGNYTVKFGVELGGCKDTITKTITIDVADADIVLTKDTTICLGTSVPLKAQPALSFCWQPTTYLTNANTLTPTATPLQNTTYYFTAEVPGTNLVRNGDFSNGNVDFTSQYTNTTKNVGESEYTVTATPQNWNPLLGACTDHTTGNGNMLLINGASHPGQCKGMDSNNYRNTQYQLCILCLVAERQCKWPGKQPAPVAIFNQWL
jgi:PKD repeat protein